MIARKMKILNTLNQYGGDFTEFSPVQKIEYKLLMACFDNLNYDLTVCADMPGLLANGSDMQKYFEQNGRRANKDFPLMLGFNFSQPTAIFAEPHSEAYCIQSLFLDVLVPEPRPIHAYPAKDIRQILKLRIDENTTLCNTHFPDFFTPRDVADRMSNQVVPRNLSHPIIRTYSTIINLTKIEYDNSYMRISTAADEINNVYVKNVSATFNFSRDIIMASMQGIRRIYAQIATEPERMRFAETLAGLPDMARFTLVGRKSFEEINNLYEMIYNKTRSIYNRCNGTYEVHKNRISYHDILFPPETLEDLPEVEVNILDYLINGVNLNVSHALALILSYDAMFLVEISLRDCSISNANYLTGKVIEYGLGPSMSHNPTYAKCLSYTNSIRENLENFLFSAETHHRLHEEKVDMAIQLLFFSVCLSLLFFMASKSKMVPKALKYCHHRLFGGKKPHHKHNKSDLEETRPLVPTVSNIRVNASGGRGALRPVRPFYTDTAEHTRRWGLR